MEVMLTSASGDVLQHEDADSEDSSLGRSKVLPGESITYLYRCVIGEKSQEQ